MKSSGAVALIFAAFLMPVWTRAVEPGSVIFSDDFGAGLKAWAVEQQPGGSVSVSNHMLVIEDSGGCTVWLRSRLTAPFVISYSATASSRRRVSDLNCFWQATEPAAPGDPPFAPGHARDGHFAAYDSLRMYYVGYGGNANTTTRFRRYDGKGARPLLPEFDRRTKAFLLEPNHVYAIRITVTADGVTRYERDGETIFEFRDPEPLRSGWFAFRTVQSRIEISRFRVESPAP